MASYTDNYALTKPTMAESADIRVINSNMDTVDDVMHSTQISLAPAYDMNETYNTGDVVMYELLMYECLGGDVTGAWDATKWQRTTAGEHGGGSDVEVTQIQTEGKTVASIAVDGVSTNILIPELKVYGEATGDLITIEDAMEAPLEECKVTLEPQQDLHGYEYPWVGGAGKNKFDISKVVSNAEVVNNGTSLSLTTNPQTNNCTAGTPNKLKDYCPTLKEGDTVTFSFKSTGDRKYIYLLGYNDQWNSGTSKTITESMLNSTVLWHTSKGVSTATVSEIQFELGQTATTFAPYSNICPISGWSAVNVTRCGKNLCTIFTDGKVPSISTGELVTAGGARSDFVRVSPSTNYIFSVESISQQLYIFYYDINKNFIRYDSNIGLYVTHITPSNCYYVMLRTQANANNIEKPQLELGTTATTYTPYVGTTTTIPLGQEVFGGKLDVVNGVLRVTYIKETLNSSDYWSWNSALKGFRKTYQGLNLSNTDTNLMCEWLPKGADTSLACIYFHGIYIDFVGLDNIGVTDAETWKTLLTERGGISFTRALVTPQEIQLTPTEVPLLRGINNLWSDGEMYIKYRRDIEMLLQRIADSLGGNA